MFFSICLIVKNEENNIVKCLEPIKNLGAEIVIVDTGSTDSTKAIAEKYTDKIYDFEWCDDFSAARNFAMSKASNDFILFLDADEYTQETHIDSLIKSARQYPDSIGQITRRNLCIGDSIYVDKVERFFNRRYYHYSGIIHEQPVRNDNNPITVYDAKWNVYHEGYIGTFEERKVKGMRNATLLLRQLEETPDDAYIYYQLGQSYELFDENEKAVEYYRKAAGLEKDTSLPYIRDTINSLSESLNSLKKYDEAVSLEGLYPSMYSNADFLCKTAYAYLQKNDLVNALYLYKKAMTCSEYGIEGTATFTPCHNIGCIFEALGNYTDAIRYFKKAGAYPKSVNKLNNIMANNNYSAFDKLSVIYISDDNISLTQQFIKALENQTIGIDYLRIVIADNSSCDGSMELLSDFEKKHSDNVVLLPFDSKYPQAELINACTSYIDTDYVCLIKDIPVADTLRIYYEAAKAYSPDIIISLTEAANDSDLTHVCRKLSTHLMSPSLLMPDMSVVDNSLLLEQKRPRKEGLSNALCLGKYLSEFISTEPEPDYYRISDSLLIIDNICFVRSS